MTGLLNFSKIKNTKSSGVSKSVGRLLKLAESENFGENARFGGDSIGEALN